MNDLVVGFDIPFRLNPHHRTGSFAEGPEAQSFRVEK
jgi:hypothetical protein